VSGPVVSSRKDRDRESYKNN